MNHYSPLCEREGAGDIPFPASRSIPFNFCTSYPAPRDLDFRRRGFTIYANDVGSREATEKVSDDNHVTVALLTCDSSLLSKVPTIGVRILSRTLEVQKDVLAAVSTELSKQCAQSGRNEAVLRDHDESEAEAIKNFFQWLSTGRLSHIVLTPTTYNLEVNGAAQGFQTRLVELYALAGCEEIPQLKDAIVTRLAEHCVEFRVELSEVFHVYLCTEPGSILTRWVVAEWWRKWVAYKPKGAETMARFKKSVQINDEFWL